MSAQDNNSTSASPRSYWKDFIEFFKRLLKKMSMTKETEYKSGYVRINPPSEYKPEIFKPSVSSHKEEKLKPDVMLSTVEDSRNLPEKQKLKLLEQVVRQFGRDIADLKWEIPGIENNIENFHKPEAEKTYSWETRFTYTLPELKEEYIQKSKPVEEMSLQHKAKNFSKLYKSNGDKVSFYLNLAYAQKSLLKTLRFMKKELTCVTKRIYGYRDSIEKALEFREKNFASKYQAYFNQNTLDANPAPRMPAPQPEAVVPLSKDSHDDNNPPIPMQKLQNGIH